MNYHAVPVLWKPVTVFKMQQFLVTAGFFTTAFPGAGLHSHDGLFHEPFRI